MTIRVSPISGRLCAVDGPLAAMTDDGMSRVSQRVDGRLGVMRRGRQALDNRVRQETRPAIRETLASETVDRQVVGRLIF
jgi:hypothetical protein